MRSAVKRRRYAQLISLVYGPDGVAYLMINYRPVEVNGGWLAVGVS